jgi:hypothetical protein
MSIPWLALISGLLILDASPPPDGSPSGDPHGILLKPIPEKMVILTFEENCTVGLAAVKRIGHEKTASPLSIALDGVPVFTLEAYRTPETWGRFTSPAFTVTAGPPTLAFILGEGGMVLIDDVVLHNCK